MWSHLTLVPFLQGQTRTANLKLFIVSSIRISEYRKLQRSEKNSITLTQNCGKERELLSI